MMMRLVAALIILSIAAADSSRELLEPIVKRHLGVLPEEVCKELIALGEDEGFYVSPESIDEGLENYNVPSQSIDVFERHEGKPG